MAHDGRKMPRGRIAELERAISKKKDGLISCLEVAEKFRADIARIEGEIEALRRPHPASTGR